MNLRELITKHTMSVTGLACLGAKLDAIATGKPIDPALDARITEVLDLLGMTPALAGVAPADAGQFCNEIRTVISTDESLLYPETRNGAWLHHDKNILQSAGDFSRGFARGLTRMFIPKLDGLHARMSADDAHFLDVGVGVAGLACEMASLWPKLRVTGLDVWAPSLALARSNIAAAGLGERVTVREQAIESLDETATYDLLWLPLPFIPEQVVPTGIERSLRALKPGGWLVTGVVHAEGSDPTAAFWRLRATMFGGPKWTLDQLQTVLAEQGFTGVHVLPTPPGAPPLVAARAP